MVGNVGPTTRRTGERFGASPGAPRRIGDGRAASDKRCALPTTAFFETPIRRPISAVDTPSAQRVFSRSMISSVQSIASARLYYDPNIR